MPEARYEILTVASTILIQGRRTSMGAQPRVLDDLQGVDGTHAAAPMPWRM